MTIEGDNAAMLAGQMPNSSIVTIAPDAIKVKTVGGMMASMVGDILSTNDDIYYIQHKKEVVYHEAAPEKNDESNKPEIKVKKLSGTATVAGHECQKYEITVGDDKQYAWAATDMKISDANIFESISPEGIDGVVLKSVRMMNIPSVGEITITTTATEVKAKKIKTSKIMPPKSYTQKEGAPMAIQQQREMMKK